MTAAARSLLSGPPRDIVPGGPAAGLREDGAPVPRPAGEGWEPWRCMSEERYAALEQRFGAKVRKVGGVWWRRIRPCFYRPLLPFEALDEAVLQRPCWWPGGYQYALADAQRANSTINFLIYDELDTYSLETLSHCRRRQIRRAAGHFQIRPITDVAELKAHGYAVYLSFYQRTRYAYKSERICRAGFDRWADVLGEFPEAIVLGAYGTGGLAAIGVAYWVKTSLIYASVFSATDALQKNVAALLLHELRRRSAQQPGIARIIARRYQGGNSLDKFYLDRGCKLLRAPARLVVNPVMGALIRWALPRAFARLTGAA